MPFFCAPFFTRNRRETPVDAEGFEGQWRVLQMINQACAIFLQFGVSFGVPSILRCIPILFGSHILRNIRDLQVFRLRKKFGGIEMSNYRESEYALNYKRAGIVYRFADSVVEISVEEFLFAHPDLTQQDFLHWKQVSDEMHLQEKLANWRCTHKDCCLDAKLAHNALAVPSAEEALLNEENRKAERLAHRKKMRLANLVLGTLSPKQRRRFLLYVVNRNTLEQIANLEGVSFQAIQLSIKMAYAKIRKYLKRREKTEK